MDVQRPGVDPEPVPAPAPEPSPDPRPAGEPALLDPALAALPFRPARRYYRAEEPDAPARTAATRYPAWLVAFTVLLTALLAHGLCVRATFYFDDWTLIVDNDWVVHRWWEANLRALTYFSYCLTHALFGFSPAAFHAGNLALHLVVSLLVAGLGRDLLAEAAGLEAERARRIGWWAGLLFAAHPLCSEALNYARWRDLQLVTLFTLLAMRAAVRWRRQRRPGFGWPTATILAVAGATVCKEVGIVLAGGAAFLVWLRTPPPSEFEARRAVAMPLPGPATSVKTKLVATPKDAAIAKGNWPVAASLILVALCVAALAWPLWATAAAALRHPRLGWHTLTKARVFWMYAQRMVVPVGLCSDHQIAWTLGFGDVVAWIAAGAEALVIAGAGWLYFRRGAAARTVGILLAVALLDIVHRLANPNSDLMAEARMYPTMSVVCILLAWGLDALLRWRWDGTGARRPLLAGYTMVALTVGCIALSEQRSRTWRDTPTLVADIIARYPMQNRAWEEQQDADVRAGYWTETLKDQERVRQAIEAALRFNTRSEHRKIYPDALLLGHISSEGNYALALAKVGRPRQAVEHMAWVQKSVPAFGELAVPCKAEFLYARGLIKEAVGQRDGAVEDLAASHKLNGNLEASRELRRISKAQAQAEVTPVYW